MFRYSQAASTVYHTEFKLCGIEISSNLELFADLKKSFLKKKLYSWEEKKLINSKYIWMSLIKGHDYSYV